MTREERDAIRKWCDEARTNPMPLMLAIKIRDGCYALLTALDQAEAERDRWKAWAEAMERAILNEAQCATCAICDQCSFGDETPTTCPDWKFDEARFLGDSGD